MWAGKIILTVFVLFWKNLSPVLRDKKGNKALRNKQMKTTKIKINTPACITNLEHVVMTAYKLENILGAI